LEGLAVHEACTQAERDEAVRIILAKNTFQEERDAVHARVYDEASCNCRTWLLVAAESLPQHAAKQQLSCDTQAPDRSALQPNSKRPVKQVYHAAATVRLNPYRDGRGRWAQIFNMSVVRERRGFGTVLLAGLEVLLQREAVDVMLLYPAENGRAPHFWNSTGYTAPLESHLPIEDLRSVQDGGWLMPEFDPATMKELPRWEKRLGPLPDGDQASGNRPPLGAQKRVGGFVQNHRVVPASKSRLTGQLLQDAARKLQEHRERLAETSNPLLL
jgi:hypothetical protein